MTPAEMVQRQKGTLKIFVESRSHLIWKLPRPKGSTLDLSRFCQSSIWRVIVELLSMKWVVCLAWSRPRQGLFDEATKSVVASGAAWSTKDCQISYSPVTSMLKTKLFAHNWQKYMRPGYPNPLLFCHTNPSWYVLAFILSCLMFAISEAHQ